MNTQKDLHDIAWYLIQCKPRQENRAREHLVRQGFECFSPTLTVESLTSGKLKSHVQPLFPGYLFTRVKAQDNWTALHSTRGVTRIVGFCGRPCRVDDSIIEGLQKRCAGEPEIRYWSAGDKVKVKLGDQSALDAIFVSMDGDERVVLLLAMMNREQPVSVPLANLCAH